MSIKDVIKKSILESDMYNQSISMSTVLTIVVDLFCALLVGLLIYYIYKRFYKGVVYSKNFAMTLVGMTVLTCMITLAISTNIVISLGMVGALSIVRYRTAIKEPLDLMYIFWAITSGITIGASMYILAAISMLIMFVLILLFSKEKVNRRNYIAVIHYQGDETGDEIMRIMQSHKYTLRSKIMRDSDVEITLQVLCKNDNLTFAEKIRAISKVNDVALLEYDGEYHG